MIPINTNGGGTEKMNNQGCETCKFFVEAEEICTEPSQPTGTDGKLHLYNWQNPTPKNPLKCKLWKVAHEVEG